MGNITWGMSMRFLTILLILGNGIFITTSQSTSSNTKVDIVVQHSTIHKRSMPIQIPPSDNNTNSTVPLAPESGAEQNMNNSDSTTVHKEEEKKTNTSTEVVTPSTNISKTTVLSTTKSKLKAYYQGIKNSTRKEAQNASSLNATTEKVNVNKRTNSSDPVVSAPEKNIDVNNVQVEIKTLNTDNSTATIEQDDMLHTHVSPHDDDDVPAAPNTKSESTADITNSTENTQGTNTTESSNLPPEIFPITGNVRSIENASPDLIAKLNHKYYNVTTSEEETTTKDVKEEQGNTTTKSVNGASDLKTNVKSLQVVQNENDSKMTKSLDGKTKKNMSSGIIALLTTITFAVIVVIAYVSMVMWRRYLEHKYGRRELLVNELEFDTNDLRHFEL